MKILVTGGAGFIGSYLVDALIKENNEVVVLDNLSTGKKEHLKNVELVKGDVTEQRSVAKAIEGCEAVFHLAAQSDARINDSDIDFKVNFLGSKNVFDAAKKRGAKIIFASSAAVYGNLSVCPENAACKPISSYGKTKLKAEKLLSEKDFIVRMFNVYGPRGHGVVNRFCSAIPFFKDIEVYGNGLQTRDFIYVSDAVKALMLGLKYSGIYNVGTGKEISLLRVIDIISSLTTTKAHVRFKSENESDIRRSKSDIIKISKELKWKPRISIEDGIDMLLHEMGYKKAPV